MYLWVNMILCKIQDDFYFLRLHFWTCTSKIFKTTILPFFKVIFRITRFEKFSRTNFQEFMKYILELDKISRKKKL